MKVQSSENKLVITEEFIFDQNKLPSDPNNHFKSAFTNDLKRKDFFFRKMLIIADLVSLIQCFFNTVFLVPLYRESL